MLKAQTQVSKMLEELIKLGRERPMLEAELNRAAGRAATWRDQPATGAGPRRRARAGELRAAARKPPATRGAAAHDGSQRQGARVGAKDYYPDFDVRVSYGQRDNFQDMRREDMISFTVAINLPVWRESKRDPRVAEAEAMREQASAMYQAS